MNCRFSCARSRQVELEQLQQQNSALSMQLRSAQVDASSARQAAEEARREVVEVRRLQVSGFAADLHADLHADSHAESPRRGLRAVVFAPWVGLACVDWPSDRPADGHPLVLISAPPVLR
jgi:hypothetical protein